MADPAAIATLDDPRIACFRDLKDRELAREGDRFIAEGEFIVRRLLTSGFPVESVLGTPARLEALRGLVPSDAAVYVADERLICGIVGYKFHLGVLACGRRKPSPTLEEVLVDPRARPVRPATLVVCPDVINHENVGALVRICAGLGADAMVLGPECCDPYWRRSIRVSMGGVFSLPIVRSGDLAGDLRRLREDWGVQLIATVLDADAEPLHEARRPGAPNRVALLIGSEDRGLGREVVARCDRRVTIPMRLGTDSLNVAVATAVILHHFTASA